MNTFLEFFRYIFSRIYNGGGRLSNKSALSDKEKSLIETAVNKHYNEIYLFILRRCGNAQAAEDICQSTFMKLACSVKTYKESGKIRGYLFKIAINCCNDYYRNEKNHLPLHSIENTPSGSEQSPKSRVNQLEKNNEITNEYHILSHVTQQYRWVEYCTTLDYFANYKGIYVNSLEDLPPQEQKELNRDLTRLENGITFASSFGWQELLKTGKACLPVIIFILSALAAVFAVSSEYENGMLALLISCKNGNNRILKTKITATLLFSVITAMLFNITMLLAFTAFFGLSGAGADSASVLCGRVQSYGECFGIMVLFSVLSAAAFSLTALAVSALCSKSLSASGGNLIILMLAVIFGCLYNFLSSNLNGFVDSLPANIPMIDYGISEYREYTRGNAIIGAYNIIAPFAPMCAILSIISVPFIYKGWRMHCK